MFAVAQVAKHYLEDENHKRIRENVLHYMYSDEFDEPNLSEDWVQDRI